MAVYDPSTGVTNIAMHAVYSSFGTRSIRAIPRPRMCVTASAITGEPYDPVTKLQNNENRWYEPSTQRWLSQDPAGLGPDSNPYRYCGNGPTDRDGPERVGRASSWWDYWTSYALSGTAAMTMSAPNAIAVMDQVPSPPNPLTQMMQQRAAEQKSQMREVEARVNLLMNPPPAPTPWSNSSFVNSLSENITGSLLFGSLAPAIPTTR